MHSLDAVGQELSGDDRALFSHYEWPSAPATRGWRPWTRVNFAASADGSIAGEGARSASVSGEMDKRIFALQRATCDAVLVGAGTARAEGYGPVRVSESLQELRTTEGRSADPVLIVVTQSANLDPTASMFTQTNVSTIVVTCAAAPQDRIRELQPVADVIVAGVGTVDLDSMAQQLGERGYRRLLCEGGPRLFNDLLSAQLVDELCLTISPLLVGGEVVRPDGSPHDPGRITHGPRLAAGAPALELARVLSHDNVLFTRWLIGRES